jgi:osmotically-inducible protein OsmY
MHSKAHFTFVWRRFRHPKLLLFASNDGQSGAISGYRGQSMKKQSCFWALLLALACGLPASSQQTAATMKSNANSAQSGAIAQPNAPAATDDAAIKDQVQKQLVTNPALKNLDVDVNHGVVTLKGSVASRADRDRAKDLASKVNGVTQVKDFIQISSESAATSANPGSASGETAQQASGSQNLSAGKNRANSNVQTSGSAVSAAGAPASEQKGANPESPGATQPATSASQTGAGVNVSGLPQSDIETTQGDQGDTLRSDIETAFGKEPVLANSNITVNVTPSEIELTGKAQNAKQKETARRIAQSYASNRRVVDHVTVTGYQNNTVTPDKGAMGQPQPQQPQR